MATIYSNNETINIDPTDDLVLYKEEFINSRIEKFLYAICALDFDDLPTPLSRIEELYKCLATGLPAPTFVPQSRVEKYLMAILGSYDASDLPAPQSRTEVLLKKILIGDTDLSDIEWLKSRYEFLLAYIAKGGEISSGSGNDFEYLRYTFSSSAYSIDRTKELPVKSAVLKGRTMFNYAQITSHNFDEQRTPVQNLNKPLEEGKSYTIIMNIVSQTATLGVFIRFGKNNADYSESMTAFNGVGLHKYLYTATNDFNQFAPYVNIEEYQTGLSAEYNQLMILEGDYREVDIPYFEGIGSVKMPVLKTTGKNLFDGKWAVGGIGSTNGLDGGGTSNIRTVNYISVEPNTTYVASSSQLQHVNVVVWYAYDKNKKFISYSTASSFFTTPSNCEFIRARTFDLDSTNMSLDCVLQIEEGSVATEYEPYKSTIVTCNEEVELRGIGGVKDELDLLTGKLIQRTIQLPLNSNYFDFKRAESADQTNTIRWQLLFKDASIANSIKVNSNGECNIIKYHKGGSLDIECIFIHPSAIPNRLQMKQLRTDTRFTTSEELESFLLENQAYVVLELATESVKTVDISVVNQDGNEAELSSFEDITHVTVTSEGILPDVEMEVAKYYPYLTFLLESVSMDTLYNTKELPVKSAILKGQTLVNVLNPEAISFTGVSNLKTDGGDFTYDVDVEWGKFAYIINGKPNTSYLIKHSEKSDETYIVFRHGVDEHHPTFTTIEEKNQLVTTDGSGQFTISVEAGAGTDFIIQNLMAFEYQEGMENWDIPYFEGIGSVKMPVLTTTGKNLVKNIHQYYPDVAIFNIQPLKNGEDYVYSTINFSISIAGGAIDIMSSLTGVSYRIQDWNQNIKTFTVPNDGVVYDQIKLWKTGLNYDVNTMNFQIEQGSVATEYEPYKSTIVTCNEEVELRGIGDIKDELDLLTGELTRRIDESGNILSQEITESIDISVVDQDGNEAELSSFEDITHVTVTSEGISPDVELSVANQFEEDLATLSLRMNNIATTQEGLEESVNEQTTEVDSTMMATTEIYEGLL